MSPTEIGPGYYPDIPNAEYHAGPGVSKSQLDLLSRSPALLKWSLTAPEDDEKKAALNIGDAAHAAILEPHRFRDEYAIGPDAPKNTKAGKAAWEEFEEQRGGRVALTHKEGRQVALMRDSVMAHPHARFLIESEGDAEASIYWRDPITGELCRCRPDKALPKMGWLLDLKTTADMGKFARSVYDYRYHVQDPFYSDGYAEHFGEAPRAFLFLVVSTSIECGRYPVRLFSLDQVAKDAGRFAYQRDLQTYHECRQANDWPGIETLSLPPWAA
ncbi:PD-(D/E)XK nuclease-like domain-containing protein [Halomonas koreensis]|uniref:PD-(D/E)XK nuclease-like domain-containing protein n=1 Tax=Halomonas koreensis TaxID=245385 RepID=A0ABU1G4X8_9GAMM|nr:PD-(D/E)XK nuclease-like domain-containing protein [Halomonas koreensis]MDR5867969.1 PD-(D/E)XK nuclease-like domain-containing protein [Halomonas koreensis]